MKYLLDAPDTEMAEWRAAAKAAGVSFAEWWRELARREVAPDQRVGVAAAEPYPTAQEAERFDAAPVAATPIPPTPDLSVGNAVVGGAAPMSGRVFRGPDPKPIAKSRRPGRA